MKFIDVLDVEFDNINIREAVERSLEAVGDTAGEYILALDSQQVLQVRKSRRLMSIIYDSLLVLPADKGIFAASKLLGMPLEHKMSALDYSSALLARLGDISGRVFILTNIYGIAQRAADDLSYRFPGVVVVGAEDISFQEDEALCSIINEAEPDLLILCMDFYEQMRFIYALSKKLRVGLILGLGRAMDAYTARRGSDSFTQRLQREPGRVFKELHIVLSALRKRIFG